MKGLKITGLVLSAIILLFVGLLALALTSKVQTWALRKAVSGQPGMTLEFESVGAGFSGADVSELKFTQDGIVVTAKVIAVRHSAWDYVSKKLINVGSIQVDDLLVDLRNMKSTPSAAAPAPTKAPTGASNQGQAATTPAKKVDPKALFEGLLKEAQLPVDIRLDTFALKGKALLPDNQTVGFDVKGGGIGAGQRGKAEWTIDFTDTKKDAPLQTLRSTGTLSLQLTADRRINAIELDTLATASGPAIAKEQVKVSVKADRPGTSNDEAYSASIGLVRGAAVEPVLKVSGQFVAAAREINGNWEVGLRSEQVAGLLAGLGLPEITSSGSGKFSLKPDTKAVAASGELQVRAAQLQKIRPELAALGTVQLKTAFDANFVDNVAQLDRLSLDVATGDGRTFAAIGVLQKITYSVTDKRVVLANPKAELARISLTAIPLSWAQGFAAPNTIDSGELSLVMAVEAEPDGSRIRTRTIEPLTLKRVNVRAGDKKLVDNVTLSFRPTLDYSDTKIIAQIADLSVSMPTGDALSGNLAAEVINFKQAPTVAFSAQLQAKVVTALKPYLPIDLGTLTVAANVEGRHEGNLLQLAKASASVNRDGNTLLGAFDLQQAVRIDLKATTIAAGNPAASVARLRVGAIPLAWGEAFGPKSKLAGTFNGATLDVSVRSADDLTVATTEAVLLRGISVTLDGKALLQALDLTTEFSATKRGNDVSYDLKRLDLKQGEAALVTLAVAGKTKLGGKPDLSAKGRLDVDLPALLKQPALVEFATLAKGNLKTTFDATVGDVISAKAAVSAKGLVAKQDNRVLGDLELTVDASVKPDGSGSFTLPLTLTSAARKSDLSITGSFGQTANKQTFLFNGKIVSNQLFVDDFQPLAGLAPAGEKPKPAAAPQPTTRVSAPANRSAAVTVPTANARDNAPFWSAVNGKFEVDLKRILYGKDYVISGVRGTAVITDSRLSLDGLEGKFKQNPFKVAAGVTFAAPQPKPYTLTGSLNVSNFDVGEFMRAANPNEAPSFESTVTVNAKLNGTGRNTDDLMQNVYGTFGLEGSKGVTRILARKGGAGSAVNLASTALSILGAARGSDTTSALGTLASTMNEMKFDKFTMKVERGADLNIKVSTLEFISPIMRLTGSGGLTKTGAPNETIQNQPMKFTFQLAAKDQFAVVLNKAGVLGGNKDEKGYYQMTQTFSIGGTPANPDSSQLWQMLGGAAARAAAGAFLR